MRHLQSAVAPLCLPHHSPPLPRQPVIQVHEEGIGNITEAGYPAVQRGDLIVFVTVQQQEFFAVGGGVHIFTRQVYVTKIRIDVYAQQFFVVAGDQ